MPLTLLSTASIWIIVIVSFAVLIGLGVLLYFLVFRHLHIKKAAQDLIRVYEADHTCLFGQDDQFLHRLKSIASSNLVYADECSRLEKAYRQIVMNDGTASAVSNSLKDAISSKRYKDLRTILPKARQTIDDFHRSVISIDEEFRDKFAEQDEMKGKLLQAQDALRAAKASYNAKHSELALVTPSTDAIFKKLDGYLEDASDHIDNARYSDAKDEIAKVQPVIDALKDAIAVLPNFCVAISTVIPEKINGLRERYDALIEQGYPLSHILMRSTFANYETDLKGIASDVKGLRLTGVKKKLGEMLRSFDAYEESFSHEIEARERYESSASAVLDREMALERGFVALKSSLEQISQVYFISQDDSDAVDAIGKSLDEAVDAKRILDAAVHNAAKQAFTTLIKKLDVLDAKTADAEAKMNAFKDRLLSFRRDSEIAWKAVAEYNAALENAELDLRSFELPELEERALPRLNSIRASLDALHALLSAKPINVSAVNAAYATLKKAADDFLSAVKTSKEDIRAAEDAIVAANRLRIDDKVLDNYLIQSEGLFYRGEFHASLENTEKAAEEARSRAEGLR